MTNRIVVEFLGLSGVGKSTLCTKVAAELSKEGLPVYLPNELNVLSWKKKKMSYLKSFKLIFELNLFLFYALGNLSYIIEITKLIIRSQQKTKEDLKWLFHIWFKRSYLMHNCTKMTGVHLFDEGIFQALWGVGFSSRKKKFISGIKDLYHIMPLPNIVIVLEASLTNIEERLATRPYQETRVEKMCKREFDVLAKGVLLMDDVKKIVDEIANNDKKIKVMAVDNNEMINLEDNIKKISKFIQGNGAVS